MTSKHHTAQRVYLNLLNTPPAFSGVVNFLALLVISGLLLLAMPGGVSQAQGPTVITSDNTLNTTVTQTGNISNITDGTIRGNNLFHSFDRFSVGTGDIASFNGPGGIENILGRVTGGVVSDIDGTLRSTINGANLFLINPAGVVLGPNASLDISGSFYVSTADFLRLGEDGIFYANPSKDSLLSVAPPSAFGFLGENPPELAAGSSAAIEIGGLDALGAPVVVVGRDGIPQGSADHVKGIAVRGPLTSEGGQVTLASVAASGEVPLTATGTVSLFDESGTPLLSKLGSIEITDGGTVDVSGNKGGTVVIRGGVLMIDSSSVSADTRGDQNGAAVGIDVEMSEKITLMGGGEIDVGFFSNSEADGNGGNIRVKAPDIQLTGESQIASNTMGGGRGGDVVVDGDTVTLTEDAEIASDVENTATDRAHGGDVSITASRITLESGPETSPEISSDTEGAGAGGSITLNASEAITIRIQGEEGGVFTNSKTGTGASGTITLDTPFLEMDSGVITARTETTGKGGNVEIHARQILLTQGAAISAKSTSDTPGAGLAGDITISETDTLLLKQNSAVTTEAAIADGGNITILAQSEVRLLDSKITTSVGKGQGGGGNIFIDPEFVILEGFSEIIANAFGGPGGNISIIADAFLADVEKSTVSASSTLGVDGQINIDAITDLSGAIKPLQESFSQTAALLRQACAERLRGGQVSSFIVGGRDGVPLEPGEVLPSPLYTGEASVIPGSASKEPMPVELAGLFGFDDQGRPYIRGWPVQGFSPLLLDLECGGWLRQ